MAWIGAGLAAGLAQAADQARFDAAYAEAVAAQEKAASVGGEWRDIEIGTVCGLPVAGQAESDELAVGPPVQQLEGAVEFRVIPRGA